MSYVPGQDVIVDGVRRGKVCAGNPPLPGFLTMCVQFPEGAENIEVARVRPAMMGPLVAGQKVLMVVPDSQWTHSWPATVNSGDFGGSGTHAVITLDAVAKGQTLVVPIASLTIA